MTFIPSFKCEHCGKDIRATVQGPLYGLGEQMVQASLRACDCEDSQKTWEQNHRAEIERRKRHKRGNR